MAEYTIIGQNRCKYCTAAIKFLEARGIDYNYIFIDGNPGLKTFLTCLNLKTVPQIWRGKEHIGGYDELHRLYTGMYPPHDHKTSD